MTKTPTANHVLEDGEMRSPWNDIGANVFSRQWSKRVFLVVRLHESWWIAQVFVDGTTVHTSEADGRDAAIGVAELAASTAMHLRRLRPTFVSQPAGATRPPAASELDELDAADGINRR